MLILLFLVKVGVCICSFPENALTPPVKDKTLIMNGLGVSLPKALYFPCLRNNRSKYPTTWIPLFPKTNNQFSSFGETVTLENKSIPQCLQGENGLEKLF